MVILPRCAAPASQILTNNMDQSKIPTIHTALADPNWTFIHFSHSIELIDKHRDTDSGLFNLADLTSVIRYRVPESDFPSRGDDRARSFGALVPVSEWEKREGVGPLLSVLYRVTIVTDESYKVTMAVTEAPWQCDNSVKSQQLNTGSAQLDLFRPGEPGFRLGPAR